jgi:signal transduction histidine kinase
VVDRAVLLGLVAVLVWVAGYASRRRHLYEAERRAYQARQAEVEAARQEERLRIARELHDVAAHGMTVITVQAGYGALVIDEQPESARAALAAIEAAGRAALAEMRQLLGVLRGHDASGAPTSPHGLADLERLITRTAPACLHIDLRVTGRPP